MRTLFSATSIASENEPLDVSNDKILSTWRALAKLQSDAHTLAMLHFSKRHRRMKLVLDFWSVVLSMCSVASIVDWVVLHNSTAISSEMANDFQLAISTTMLIGGVFHGVIPRVMETLDLFTNKTRHAWRSGQHRKLADMCQEEMLHAAHDRGSHVQDIMLFRSSMVDTRGWFTLPQRIFEQLKDKLGSEDDHGFLSPTFRVPLRESSPGIEHAMSPRIMQEEEDVLRLLDMWCEHSLRIRKILLRRSEQHTQAHKRLTFWKSFANMVVTITTVVVFVAALLTGGDPTSQSPTVFISAVTFMSILWHSAVETKQTQQNHQQASDELHHVAGEMSTLAFKCVQERDDILTVGVDIQVLLALNHRYIAMTKLNDTVTNLEDDQDPVSKQMDITNLILKLQTATARERAQPKHFAHGPSCSTGRPPAGGRLAQAVQSVVEARRIVQPQPQAQAQAQLAGPPLPRPHPLPVQMPAQPALAPRAAVDAT